MGALTSKPYAFSARPWELKSFDSIDLNDAVGSNIRVDMRGLDIMRVLPRVNELLNESWITDKVRFAYDGLSLQRLGSPLFRRRLSDSFSNISWTKALSSVRAYFPFSESFSDVAFSEHSSFEDLSLVKHTFGLFRPSLVHWDASTDILGNWFLDSKDYDFSNFDFFLILGINLRFELPSLNLRIRKVSRSARPVPVFYSGSIGGDSNILTYSAINVGSLERFWSEFYSGRSKLCRKFYSSKRPCVLMSRSVYLSLLTSVLPLSVLDALSNCTLKVLLDCSSRGSLNDLAISEGSALSTLFYKAASTTSLFNFGSDNKRFSGSLFTTYMGFHGDQGADAANLVIPALHPYESAKSSYINVYGQFQSILKVRTFSRFVADVRSLIFSAFGAPISLGFCSYASEVPLYLFRMLRYYEVSESFLYGNILGVKLIYNYNRYFNSGFSAIYKNYSRALFHFMAGALFNSTGYSFYFDSSTARASHLMAVSHNRFKNLTSFGC